MKNGGIWEVVEYGRGTRLNAARHVDDDRVSLGRLRLGNCCDDGRDRVRADRRTRSDRRPQ